MAYGFIYCLGNEYMPETYKIGMTERSPTQRSIELSNATGVPVPFDLLCYGEVEEPLTVEKELHEYFSDFRVSQSREFFKCDYHSISEVIDDVCMSFVETEYGAHVRHFDYLYGDFYAAEGRQKAELFIDLVKFSGLCVYRSENHIHLNGSFSPSNIILKGAFQLMIPLLKECLEINKPANTHTNLKIVGGEV